MRVCTSAQMAAIDRETIEGGVSGLELMERAGGAMTEVLLDFLADEDLDGGALVLVGKGNNGGDGLVVARLLEGEGLDVTVMLLARPGDLQPDAGANFKRLPRSVEVVMVEPSDWAETFEELSEGACVVVDAVFGTGVKPPLRAEYATLFRAVNDAGMPCVALDVPSGVCGDDGRVDPVAVACDLTITVGLPKLGLLQAPGRDFTGDIEVVDIGFPEEVCNRHAPDIHYLEREDYAALLPARPSWAHKYRFGKALLVAGSRSFGGAAHLAALGALRSGAGLVTLAAPDCLEIALRGGLPEVLQRPLPCTETGTIAAPGDGAWADLLAGQSALGIGPGLDADEATDAWLIGALETCPLPLVVDADALGAFARCEIRPRFAHGHVIMTPHPGEFSRLWGLPVVEVQARRFELAAQAAAAWNAVVMLKGSPTVIAAPDGRVFINPSGDDALARGGSGDVLTGLLAGLLAQGMPALAAALLGAYVHGLAGSLAATEAGSRSVLVREAAAALGPVLLGLEKTASVHGGLREAIWPVSESGDSGGAGGGDGEGS
ncbi:MAG: NAD(P)H-hydrate dehydratase [Candidatus Krumholzibacteriia bacterium]